MSFECIYDVQRVRFSRIIAHRHVCFVSKPLFIIYSYKIVPLEAVRTLSLSIPVVICS